MNRGIKIGKGIKASLVYTIASFITKGISFITVPIFTRIMSSAEIGIATTFSSWMSILGVFAALGLNSGAYNIAMNEFKDERDQYATSALVLTSIASVVLGAVYFLFFNQINLYVGLPWQLMLLMIIGFLLQPAIDFWMTRQRYEYKYVLPAIVSVGTAVLSSVLAVIAVLLAKNNGYESLGAVRVTATYLVYDVVALGIYIFLLIRGKACVKKKYLSFALKVSLPLMIHSLAKHILDASDKIMIQKIVGNSAVGIYGTLFTISTLSLIFWNAINASLIPFLFSRLDGKNGEDKEISGVVSPIIMFYGIISVFLSLISPEIVRVIATTEYYEARYLMPPVAAGIFFTSVYNIMGNILLYHKQSVKIMIATVCAALINIVTNYIFIPLYGYVAAAYTTLFANIFLAFAQYIMAKKQHGRLPINEKQIWLFSLVVTILILLCNLLYLNDIIRYIIVCLILSVLIYKRTYFVDLIKSLIKK